MTPYDRHPEVSLPVSPVAEGFVAPLPVTLHGVTTAYPPYRFSQSEIASKACQVFGHRSGLMDRMAATFQNSGVRHRNSCVPLEWYEHPHGWPERMRLFEENALALLTDAGERAMQAAGVAPREIAATVTVSSTGIATPSLDSLLQGPLGLSPTVQRLPVFGLGCGGGVIGLARAAAMARANPGRWVLFLCTELCGLTFRRSDDTKANIIGTTIFGDGAAAMLVRTASADAAASEVTVDAWGEHTWPDTRDIMGWRIEDDGLGVVFSRDIPTLVKERMKAASDEFLAGAGVAQSDLDGYLVHPGGEKVVSAIEEVYGLPPGGLKTARDILSERGNMSAVTVLAVLERAIAEGARGRHLMSALGPGFSAGFALLTLR